MKHPKLVKFIQGCLYVFTLLACLMSFTASTEVSRRYYFLLAIIGWLIIRANDQQVEIDQLKKDIADLRLWI